MTELDNSQRHRLVSVFEKLGKPSDDFYLQVRDKTTIINNGLRDQRKCGISTMMPYQYWYHRYGESTHTAYPSYMDPTAIIGRETPFVM